MRVKQIVLLFFLFTSLIFNAQDAKPDAYQDSLQTIVQSSKDKVQKKEALFLLGEHLVQRNPQLAEEIGNDIKANYLNKKSTKEKIRLHCIYGASHRWQGNYTTSLENYNEAYSLSKKSNDSLEIARSSYFIGSINMFVGNNVLAQKHLLEASKIYDKIGKPIEKAEINKSLASFYLNLNQFEKGKDLYIKALEQFKVLNDSAGMSSVNANLGYVYTELGDFKRAEYHLMEQKKLNVVFPTLREMGFHHDFLGLLRQKQGRLEDAYKEHLKGYLIRKKLSSTYNVCESSLNMGEVLIKLKRYDEAIPYLQDIFIYKEHESLNQRQTAYYLLSEAYEKKGEIDLALANFKRYKEVSDSIFSEESLEIIAEKESQYNQQKKDNEIQLLNKEKEISEAKLSRFKTLLILFLIGLGIVSVASFALYKLYAKIKAKNNIIEKALKDRELLLHETHHRVKNNLQMISSLLNLQSKYVEDKKALEALQKGRNRVESIAILHKHLYTDENLTKVNIQNYFESLVANIMNSYSKGNRNIEVKCNAKGILMDVESVIPIGFIVNELVTNTLKHAFPNQEEVIQQEISIEMKEFEKLYVLQVNDNGIGMKEEVIKNEKEETFGQRLIQSFIQKLKANLSIDIADGTHVKIEIPKKS
ncbi:histidine kinase dimerization/phosphoacceptor domain -containing protein [Flavobacterium sp.]|uniref:histidine kinase dimerization/phosphoacceptor domain -containing protein n=1 Tax=Flavobacterium sp. TaxID=239 RepID=UPI0035292E95